MATRHPKSPLGVVTISLGVASMTPGESFAKETLLAAADEALYARQARRAQPGRDGQRAGHGEVSFEFVFRVSS